MCWAPVSTVINETQVDTTRSLPRLLSLSLVAAILLRFPSACMSGDGVIRGPHLVLVYSPLLLPPPNRLTSWTASSLFVSLFLSHLILCAGLKTNQERVKNHMTALTTDHFLGLRKPGEICSDYLVVDELLATELLLSLLSSLYLLVELWEE